jgi:hypothetical protein
MEEQQAYTYYSPNSIRIKLKHELFNLAKKVLMPLKE